MPHLSALTFLSAEEILGAFNELKLYLPEEASSPWLAPLSRCAHLSEEALCRGAAAGSAALCRTHVCTVACAMGFFVLRQQGSVAKEMGMCNRDICCSVFQFMTFQTDLKRTGNTMNMYCEDSHELEEYRQLFITRH